MANNEIYQDMYVLFRNLAEMQTEFKLSIYSQALS
ncbi:hypothetical protein EDF75_4624 [Raoultella sp. BIGb0149]|nr:hypothetical protein EDF75_4624 [Raoultella sp. BIGb0149]